MSIKDKVSGRLQWRLLYVGYFSTAGVAHLYFKIPDGFKPEQLPINRNDLLGGHKELGLGPFGASKRLCYAACGDEISVEYDAKNPDAYYPKTARRVGRFATSSVVQAWGIQDELSRTEKDAARLAQKVSQESQIDKAVAPIAYLYGRLRTKPEKAALLARVIQGVIEGGMW